MHIARLLASPKLATWVLAWLMVLLVLGTLAQANMGLYQAQQLYFSSFVLWIGPIPTPGGATTMALLGVGLSLRLLLYPWRKNTIGSLLAHLSVWLLLVGGLATALVAHEGYIQITEGQSRAVMESYHTPELAVINPSGTTLIHYPATALQNGARLTLGDKVLVVEDYFPNSLMTQRPEPIEDGLTKGARRFFAFTNKNPEIDDERNRPTLLFTLEDSATRPLAKLVVFQNQPIPQPLVLPTQPSATLVLRPMQTPLPFTVHLKRFEAEYYPGTGMARHYASVVEVESPKSGLWPATIRMNAPLRYAGYTLYQSSFMNGNQSMMQGAQGPQTSILAVVKNQGFFIPYLAGILLCIGLVLHGFLRWRKLLVLALLLPILAPVAGQAQTVTSPSATTMPNLPMAVFARLPIQHEGRIKPLYSYAELTLKNLSSRANPMGMSASQWLAEIIFAPERAGQAPLFKVPSLALQERLKLTPREHRTYSYAELVPVLQPQFIMLQKIAAQPENARDPLDAQLLTLADQVQLFFTLTQTGQPQNPATGVVESPLKIHPPRLGEAVWLAPLTAPEGPYQTTWAAMALAYQNADANLWDIATQAAWRQMGQQPDVRRGALRAEIALRQFHPFGVATGLFVVAFMLVFWARTQRFAWPVLGLGAGVSIIALAARIYILQRPPVGTLYESIVFVGCVVVVVALAAAWRKGAYQNRWLQIGAFTGLAVQALGLRYASASADTLGVLVAVLDTNFWLTTHVLVVTAGYGLALIAGVWAHTMLLGKVRTPSAFKGTDVRWLTLLLIWALALTATGTLLGGIWADQSWGRFWGWDPKENGALLLTLWLAWLLHARLAGVVQAFGLVVASAFSLNLVAVAWFGVNLLGVGLHSYGFTKNGLMYLLMFLAVEAIFIAALALRARQKGKASCA